MACEAELVDGSHQVDMRHSLFVLDLVTCRASHPHCRVHVLPFANVVVALGTGGGVGVGLEHNRVNAAAGPDVHLRCGLQSRTRKNRYQQNKTANTTAAHGDDPWSAY